MILWGAIQINCFEMTITMTFTPVPTCLQWNVGLKCRTLKDEIKMTEHDIHKALEKKLTGVLTNFYVLAFCILSSSCFKVWVNGKMLIVKSFFFFTFNIKQNIIIKWTVINHTIYHYFMSTQIVNLCTLFWA